MQSLCSVHIITIQCSYTVLLYSVTTQCKQWECHYKGYIHSVIIHVHVHNITIQCTDTMPLQRSHSVNIQSVCSITIKCTQVQCMQCHALWCIHHHYAVYIALLHTVIKFYYTVSPYLVMWCTWHHHNYTKHSVIRCWTQFTTWWIILLHMTLCSYTL